MRKIAKKVAVLNIVIFLNSIFIFFKLKIPLPILNTYNSFYLAFLRDYLNAKVNPDYEDKYYTDTAIDLEDLEYLKMDKFSKFLRKMKEKE